MRELKYRQPIYRDGKFDRFRTWGRISVGFRLPILPGNCDGEIKPDEQFTGHKDSEGKELYEGDIFTSGEHFKGVVEFNAHVLGLGFKRLNPIDAVWWYYDELAGGDKELKIIGNVHQNPELLEGN